MEDVTALIRAARGGDANALPAVFARVYAELKQLARHHLAGHAVHTIDTTGLVHEAFLKLVQPGTLNLEGRHHFFALAAKAMRQIVIDHARARLAEKRGGEHVQLVALDEAADVPGPELRPDELLRLDLALAALEREEPALSELVELRFFAGMTLADIAGLRAVSERTLNRDWRRVKAHLHATLYPEPSA